MEDEQPPGPRLPRSFESAWGQSTGQTKGPRPNLTTEAIIDAAIGLAQAEGIDAVSMGRVAKQLGVATMALYRYVEAKNELLALMVDKASSPPPPFEGDDWRQGLEQWAWHYYGASMQNAWALSVPITGMPSTPNIVRLLETGLSAMRRTRLTSDQKMDVVLLLSGFVRNHATLMATFARTRDVLGLSVEGSGPAWGELYRRLTNIEEFPNLHAVIDDGFFEQANDPGQTDPAFEFGLRCILDGIATLLPPNDE